MMKLRIHTERTGITILLCVQLSYNFLQSVDSFFIDLLGNYSMKGTPLNPPHLLHRIRALVLKGIVNTLSNHC